MRFTDTEIEDMDLEWFAVDGRGHIAYFTKDTGGVVPEAVRQSKEALETLRQFFWEELKASTVGALHPLWHVKSDVDPARDLKWPKYVEDHLAMSSKGLFSFDAYALGYRPTNYFAVGRPLEPITIESLPSHIRALLETSRFHCLDFSLNDDIPQQRLSTHNDF
jgi:hypothetical protein